jgi:hypothetical protein
MTKKTIYILIGLAITAVLGLMSLGFIAGSTGIYPIPT